MILAERLAMSEQLFKFLLSEITVIRVHCRNSRCGGIVEVPIEKLASMFGPCACPLCNQPFDTGTFSRDGSLFHVFAKSIERLKQIKDNVEIEFVFPVHDAKHT